MTEQYDGASEQFEAGTVQSAHEEWEFRTVEGDFGNEFDTRIPCQLRFKSEPEQDTDRFHAALDERGFSPIDANPDGKYEDRGTWYHGEIMSQEFYNRIDVIVFRKNVVRLFPPEDVPSTHELQNIISALEVGFNAELEHDPMDREDNDAG